MLKKIWLILMLGIALAGCGGSGGGSPTGGNVPVETEGTTGVSFFDDFSYTDPSDPNLVNFHWSVRQEGGAPGFSDGQFKPSQISFVEDGPTNKFMRFTAETDGTTSGCKQAEIYHQQKFLAGTYAARVRFYDDAVEGNDGDVVVSTFFTIRDTDTNTDPNYSECDFEYLLNGGWERDKGNPSLYFTSWAESIVPDVENTEQTIVDQSFSGWHTLFLRVDPGSHKVEYFVDGVLRATHSGSYYPKAAMSINFNLWFSPGVYDLRQSDHSLRRYRQDVDWVFYAKNKLLTTDEVFNQVANLRAKSVQRVDTLN